MGPILKLTKLLSYASCCKKCEHQYECCMYILVLHYIVYTQLYIDIYFTRIKTLEYELLVTWGALTTQIEDSNNVIRDNKV